MKRSYECTRPGMGSAEYSWKGDGAQRSHDMTSIADIQEYQFKSERLID